MKPTRNITDLLRIMERLRDPETGCPWDVKQSFETIVPYTIEEVYEVADAIHRNDKVDLCDELGDLLFQIVYYARMAEEEGSFNFGDVVFAITKKMIRRHPHVFGSETQRQTGLVDGEWDRIKAEEKAERTERRRIAGLEDDTPTGYLASVKNAQPVDKEAIKLQEKAAKVGFDWRTPKPILDKLNEELSELVEALSSNNKNRIEEEFGDVYFTLINLARRLTIDPEKALEKTNKKFRKRFGFIENALSKMNKNLDNASLEEMEKLWNAAKKEEDI